jgi:diadenosine tetraphosphate (Ap4A) HIT family hydrolase|tara:strand:+ start:640 stop:1047 length:408 start_codon:yes stop_codon:yes gene_type:complete
MQSKKRSYKKPREVIDFYEESTWLGNDTPFFENEYCAIFKDKYPVTKGHILFVPKKNTPETISETYKLAMYCGEEWIKKKMIDGFNIGQNIGLAAGQTIMWPHIHLIPRKDNDCDNTKHNGIRLSFPDGDHNEYY